ncbi:MAG: hypothetical protein ACI8WB_002216, partial [Phenylobacterium sp.]
MSFFNLNYIERDEYLSSKNVADLTLRELAYVHLNMRHSYTYLKNDRLSSNLYDLNQTLSASFSNDRTHVYGPLMTSFA